MSRDETLPMEVRGMMKIWSGAEVENLISNGSFEQEGPLPKNFGGGSLVGAKRRRGDATDGEWSLEVRRADFDWRIPVQTNKTYMLMLDIKDVKGSAEGRFNMRLSPCKRGNVPVDHIRSLDNVLPGGVWTTMSLMVKAIGRGSIVENIEVNLWTKKYEPGETVLIDNVRLVCLDDLK